MTKALPLCYNDLSLPTVLSSEKTMSKRQNHHPSQQSNNEPTLEQAVIARPFVRVMAIVYDGMLILAMLFLVGAVLSVLGTVLFLDVGSESKHAQTLPTWYQNLVLTPSFVLTLVGFYGIFWRKSGQTLGMQTWRLKTVDLQGNLLSWRLSFVRIISACLVPIFCALLASWIHGSRFASLLALMFGFSFNYVFCLLNSRGLAVHDMLSGTITLKVPKVQHETLWQMVKRKRTQKNQS